MKNDDPDHNIGLGDQVDTSGVNFSDFEVEVRLFADGDPTPGTFGFDARDGGTHLLLIDSLTINTWYNVWIVINQSSDSFSVYLNTGTADAGPGDRLNTSPLAFRNGTASPLDTILALAGPGGVDNGVLIDDLTFLSGVDPTNPLGGLDPQYYQESATLTGNDNLTLYAGATVELGVADPNDVDLLDVSGQLKRCGDP